MELTEKEEELGGIESDKVQFRIVHVKTVFAEELYNAGKFNFTMLEWAIKEVIKEEDAERKRREAAEKKAQMEREGAEGVVESKKGLGKLVYLLVLLPILAILVNMFVL